MSDFFRSKQCVLSRRVICSLVAFAFLFSLILPPSIAQLPYLANLPAPGQMIWLTPGFQPPVLRGMTVHTENPLLFDFIVDRGQDKINDTLLKEESTKLIKYFLAAMTIPDKDAWVNLSPYEKDRIIPDALGQTEMGRQMLEQDYILKQLSASLTNPDKELGQKFWNEVKSRVQKQFGTTEVPLSTFNKVWIVPDGATVVEKDGFAYITESKLKVMLDEDYVALNSNLSSPNAPIGDDRKSQNPDPSTQNLNKLSSEVFREMILPKLIKEVNSGKNFAQTRQVYQSVILAAWYKKALKDSLLGKIYANKSKVEGVESDVKDIKQKVYEQYLEAFKKGVYNVIKEEDGVDGDLIPRKYFSGGVELAMNVSSSLTRDTNPINFNRAMATVLQDGDQNVLVSSSATEAGEKTAVEAAVRANQVSSAASAATVGITEENFKTISGWTSIKSKSGKILGFVLRQGEEGEIVPQSDERMILQSRRFTTEGVILGEGKQTVLNILDGEMDVSVNGQIFALYRADSLNVYGKDIRIIPRNKNVATVLLAQRKRQEKTIRSTDIKFGEQKEQPFLEIIKEKENVIGTVLRVQATPSLFSMITPQSDPLQVGTKAVAEAMADQRGSIYAPVASPKFVALVNQEGGEMKVQTYQYDSMTGQGEPAEMVILKPGEVFLSTGGRHMEFVPDQQGNPAKLWEVIDGPYQHTDASPAKVFFEKTKSASIAASAVNYPEIYNAIKQQSLSFNGIVMALAAADQLLSLEEIKRFKPVWGEDPITAWEKYASQANLTQVVNFLSGQAVLIKGVNGDLYGLEQGLKDYIRKEDPAEITRLQGMRKIFYWALIEPLIPDSKETFIPKVMEATSKVLQTLIPAGKPVANQTELEMFIQYSLIMHFNLHTLVSTSFFNKEEDGSFGLASSEEIVVNMLETIDQNAEDFKTIGVTRRGNRVNLSPMFMDAFNDTYHRVLVGASSSLKLTDVETRRLTHLGQLQYVQSLIEVISMFWGPQSGNSEQPIFYHQDFLQNITRGDQNLNLAVESSLTYLNFQLIGGYYVFSYEGGGAWNDFVKFLQATGKVASSSSTTLSPTAVTASALMVNPGGIDFDPTLLNLQIKRDGHGVPLPLPQQDLLNIDIKGLYPVIINIMPINVQTLPILGQLTVQPDATRAKRVESFADVALSKS